MRSAQVTIDEIRAVTRRRWKLLVFASLTVIILSIIGAYTLPRRYVSTTKILVQRDETLNPLVSFSMAVTLASEDRLRTFNEIIFSRRMSGESVLHVVAIHPQVVHRECPCCSVH